MDAIEKAVSYLNVKPRTRKQTTEYLKGKGYDSGEIEEAADRLEEYGYLNDLDFARMYFEYGFEKGRGIVRLRRELEEKGVDRSLIDEAYSQLEDVPDQFEAALDIAFGITEGASAESYEEKQKLRAKVVRRLASRGYSGDVAYRAAKEAVK